MNTDLMFSSATDKWDTQQDLINDLATVFDWDIDVCASRRNVCDYYFTEAENGLSKSWLGLAWCNPPYGKGIKLWYEKAFVESRKRSYTSVVMLVPSRPDTRYWHKFVPHASFIVDIKGRLKFGNATNSAPFPSSFVVFGDISTAQKRKLASYGQWYRYGGVL